MVTSAMNRMSFSLELAGAQLAGLLMQTRTETISKEGPPKDSASFEAKPWEDAGLRALASPSRVKEHAVAMCEELGLSLRAPESLWQQCKAALCT